MPLKNLNISTSIPADQDNLNKIEALANIGSFEWDATTDQLEWSKHLYRIYGYEPFSVEPTFSFFLDHLEETCRLEFIDTLDRHVATGNEFQFMERIIKSDGSRAILQSQIKPVLNDLKELVQVIGVCRDVTELTLKDEQLKSQKQFFEDVLDELPVAIMIIDVEGSFHNFNDKFIEIFGTPNGIMPNAKEAMNVQKSDLDFLMEMNRKCLEHKTTLTFSRWIQFNDSDRRNILFINRPLSKNYRISQSSVLTIGIDQTKEAILKENQETNEKRLTVASEGGNLGILDWDLLSGKLECNEIFFDIFGLDPATFEPSFERFISNLLYEADKPEITEKFQNIIAGNVPKYELNYRINSPGKGLVWISDKGRVLFDQGKPHRLIAVLQDITNERNFEARITETNDHLSNIIKTAPGAVFRCEPAPGLPVEMLNRQIVDISGYEPEAFAPLGPIQLEDIILEIDRVNNRELMTSAIDRGLNQFQNSFRIRTKDQKERWVWMKTQIERNKNGVVGLEGFLVDITDQVSAEDRIISATLQAEDNQRQHISEEIHDGLQQTLISALMGLQNLTEKIAEKAPELSGKYEMALKTLKAGVEETRNIAHSIMPKSIEDFGLLITIDQIIYQLNSNGITQYRIFENLEGLRLEKKIEVSLYRIFQEAINNINKHANASDVVVQIIRRDQTITMNIEDDGDGFDPTDLGQLKSGFGLSSMRSRASSLSGTADISSKPGKGTSILVEIPLNH